MAIYSTPSSQNFDNWWFGSGKTNALLDLINEQDDTDKTCFYAKDLSDPSTNF